MHQEDRPISELLPWLFMLDGDATVVNKDSSLMAVFYLQGIDVESVDPFGLEDAAVQFDKALRFAASQNVRIWTRADRYKAADYQYGDFSIPMSAEIDQIWGKTFEKNGAYENSQTLIVSMPTQHRARTVAELARDYIDDGIPVWRAMLKAVYNRISSAGKDRIGFETKEELDAAHLRFEQNVVMPLRQQLHHFKLTRLTGSDLCGYLTSCTSSRPPAQVEVNETSYLDAVLSDTFIDNRYRDYLILDGVTRSYATVVTLKSGPPADRVAALDSLMALPMRLTVANCWRASTPEAAIKDLKGARTFDEMRRMDLKSLLRSAVRGETELVAEGTEPETPVGRSAETYIAEIKNGDARWGYLATSIIVYADNLSELDRNVELVVGVLEKRELAFIREREGAISGFSVAIPGNIIDPVRWFHVEASNLTDLAPVVTIDSGNNYHPHFSSIYRKDVPPAATMRSRYGTTQYVNYHNGALGHTLYIGPSRNGKTMHKMFMTSQLFKYPNARAIILDKDYSCEAPTLLHDGVCIDLSPEATNSIRLNPLSYAKYNWARPFLIGWIDRLMSARGEPLTDKEIEDVSKGIQAVALIPNVRLTTLSGQLPMDLRSRLALWVKGGAYGDYFDNEVDELTFDRITCIEVGGLISSNLTVVLNAFTDYLFFRVEHMLNEVTAQSDIGPTEIYFEEAGYLLDDPIFAKRAFDYLTTLAKKQAYLVMTAQSPEPFFRNERLKAAVRDNIATVILLPNQGAARGDLAQIYKTVFGVNDNHLALLASAIPKMEYCFWQPQTGIFRVAVMLLPEEIQARLMSDKSSRSILGMTYDPTNPVWKTRYLSRLIEHITSNRK